MLITSFQEKEEYSKNTEKGEAVFAKENLKHYFVWTTNTKAALLPRVILSLLNQPFMSLVL